MTWKEIASEKGIAGNFAMQHLPGWSCWCKHPIMTLRNENETEIAKRHVTHLWPTKGSCANFLDPLSRRCARLNHCQPTSLSFKLHQKFNGWNFKRNKSEWESRHHLDLIPVEICHRQDLKNICWHQNGHLHLLPGMHTPRNNNMCWKRKGLTVLPLSLSLALH